MEVNSHVNVWEKIIKSSLDIICTVDRNGCFINVNGAFRRVLGYEEEEVVGRHFSEFVHPDDLTPTLNITVDIINGSKISNFENQYVHKNGQLISLVWSAVWSEEDEVVVSVGRDITQQKQARNQQALHHALIEHGADMLALFDEELNYLYSGGAVLRQLGYSPEELAGTNALSYIHPEDIPLATEALAKALTSEKHATVPAFRFRDAKGEWRWLESTLSNQLKNPAVKALVTSSRDVTERVQNRQKLKESEQRFKSLFENHLDAVFFQDREGLIMDANATMLSFFGVQKQEILNTSFTEFLTPDLVPVCQQAFDRAMRGEWVRYVLTIPFENKGTFTFDIAKVPVVVNGEIIGAYSILRDITAISRSNHIIKRQAEKLNTVMESITEAFFTLDKNWHITYVNSELERMFKVNREQLLGESFWDVAEASIRQELKKQFDFALETGNAAHFEIYMEAYAIWVQVKAFPSEEGLSVFTYDITERVKSKQELEKLSLVASKTTNGVVITDATGLIEWVNEGFTNLTGYSLSEVVGKSPSSFLFGEENSEEEVKQFLERRSQGKPFHIELMNYTKSGEKVWFLLDVTPVLNGEGEITRYITIQTDVSERKEVEASQLRLAKDLYRQNKDLQQFTYIVSHNLRAPVANAMGLVDLLSTTDNDPETFNLSLGYLKKSVNQLDTVLRDLNMILSIRDKNDTIGRERTSLALVCRQVIADLQVPLEACGGSVHLDVADNVSVHGDKAYLYSVFHNLLSNAIKYRSPKRALKVNIKSFNNAKKGIMLSFSDNGSGFDMQLAGDKIFKLYKRFHTGFEGRGMGLYLVKTHLEAMGGYIEVASEPDAGTRFLLYLK